MALTPADQTLIEDFATSRPAIQAQARARWASSESYQHRQIQCLGYNNRLDGLILGRQQSQQAQPLPCEVAT